MAAGISEAIFQCYRASHRHVPAPQVLSSEEGFPLDSTSCPHPPPHPLLPVLAVPRCLPFSAQTFWMTPLEGLTKPLQRRRDGKEPAKPAFVTEIRSSPCWVHFSMSDFDTSARTGVAYGTVRFRAIWKLWVTLVKWKRKRNIKKSVIYHICE